MCLAVPGKIVELEEDRATVDLHGNRIGISTVLTPGAVVGDWVLVHAGFAIQKLDGDDVKETWAVLEDMKAADEATR